VFVSVARTPANQRPTVKQHLTAIRMLFDWLGHPKRAFLRAVHSSPANDGWLSADPLRGGKR
jgi:hypothetical protein